jgi:hypothetical protein
MPDQLSILLVPAKGDKALLAKEPCGGEVPTMTHGDDCVRWYPYGGDCPCGTRALVIAYEGKPVPIGVGRAAGVLGKWWWDNSPVRLRRWLAGDRTATHLIDPASGVRVVVLRFDGSEWREVADV